VTPIYQSSAYAVTDAAESTARHQADLPNYARDRFPNVRALEAAVADLEGAEAGCAAASGMAAISLVFLSLLASGDHVVLGSGGYCDTGDFLDGVLRRFGVEMTLTDASDPAAVERAITPATQVLFVETIANPSMRVPDLDALSTISRRHNITLVVDNTFATPIFCRPLAHGADLVLHSATKFLGGHHDLTAGVVVGSTQQIERVRRTGYLIGAQPGALDAWLALRGIHTLAARMTWIAQTADAVAHALVAHPAVREVRYPALAREATGSDASVVARMLPDGAGGMLMFQVASDAVAEALVRRLRLIAYVPSLGGVGTTICFPPRPLADQRAAHRGDGWLRLSVGLEAPVDVIADLTRALDTVGEEEA
jgi:cystathionine beta-lyase/cystathionine gamma-synthase